MDPEITDELNKSFPGVDFYIEDISFERTYGDTKFEKIIKSLKDTDDLASHLYLMPDFIVMSRKGAPEEGIFFIKMYRKGIKLSQEELEIYTKFYPSKFLLGCLSPSEVIWVNDYKKNSQ